MNTMKEVNDQQKEMALKENIFASCSGLAPVSVSGSLKQLG